jgi:uncharacterized protein
VNFYLDTSFLIPIFINEARSRDARAWFRLCAARVIVADFAALEFSAVMTRGLRTGVIPEQRLHEIFIDFDGLRGGCRAHAHTADDIRLAERLLRDIATKLAAPDALHLASALNLGARLVTYDDRLLAAATSAGASVELISGA